jgi:hypothetical protein
LEILGNQRQSYNNHRETYDKKEYAGSYAVETVEPDHECQVSRRRSGEQYQKDYAND